MRKIIYFILFVLSSTILAWMYSLVLESEQYDNEYAKISFDGKSTTKEYEFDEFNYLYFFYDMDSLTEFTKNTVFVDFVPDLKIINSEEYKVVITANSDVFEKMKVDLSGETSYLEVLLTSSSMTEFLAKYYAASELIEYDKELFEKDTWQVMILFSGV